MKITWDDVVSRVFSQGVSKGVLYPEDAPGVPWNGLVSINEAGEADQDARYFDGQRYSNRGIPGVFAGTISAYTYPAELEPYIGINGVLRGQNRKSFGFSYRTNNEIHLVYNTLTAPAKNTYGTLGDKTEALTFDWDFTTTPVEIPGGRPSSHIVVMVDQSQPGAITDLEALIYGTDTDDPALPDPADIVAIFESYTTVQVTDHGDGSYTVTGPDADVTVTGDSFTVNWPSAMYIPNEDELVETTTFEDGVSGWSFWGGGTAVGTVVQSSAWSRHGSYSGLLTVTVQGTGSNEAIHDVPAEPGDYLTVVFTVHAPAAISNLAFSIDWKNASSGYISSSAGISGISMAAGEDRTFIYRVGPAPSNTAHATLIFAFPTNSVAGTAMAFDDVSVFVQKPTQTFRISSL
jgi:hypothetical protein